MKKVYLLAAIFLITSLLYNSAIAQQASLQSTAYQQKMQSSSLLFMENKGQIGDNKGNPQRDILFTASSGGAKIYLTATGIHYQFSKTEYPEGYNPTPKRFQRDARQEAL